MTLFIYIYICIYTVHHTHIYIYIYVNIQTPFYDDTIITVIRIYPYMYAWLSDKNSRCAKVVVANADSPSRGSHSAPGWVTSCINSTVVKRGNSANHSSKVKWTKYLNCSWFLLFLQVSKLPVLWTASTEDTKWPSTTSLNHAPA